MEGRFTIEKSRKKYCCVKEGVATYCNTQPLWYKDKCMEHPRINDGYFLVLVS